MKIQATNNSVTHHHQTAHSARVKPNLHQSTTVGQDLESSLEIFQAELSAKVDAIRTSLVSQAKAKIQSGEYFEKDTALEVANAILKS